MRNGRAAATIITIVFMAAGAHAAFAIGPCSRTARLVKKACDNEVQDDYYIAMANCFNIEDAGERQECFLDAPAEWNEGLEECDEQFAARLELCEELGEDRYDPDFDPIDFATEFDEQNAYYPLEPGNTWSYEGDGETITVEVLDKTKLIEGVTCIVVNDVVEEDGELIEDTDDWYAVALNGDVWYCGEVARDYETFEGDDPEEPELIEIEGSWKAGRDGAKPGIIMFGGFPDGGTIYRQEVSYGNAEDVAELVTTTYGYGNDPELDQFVPQELAELLCDDDCAVTRDFTPIEPDVEEFKYFAPGIGLFLEVNREEGTIVQLVDCNLGPVCNQLPSP